MTRLRACLGRLSLALRTGACGESEIETRFARQWIAAKDTLGFDPIKLSFKQGGPIPVLTAPDTKGFILIARTLSPTATTPTVPEGWTLEREMLAEPFRVMLDGPVTVLRTDNDDSFQGPLPPSMAMPLAK